ncbi:hypothetical protein [Ancylobacter oerskovii]|uniref:Integrase n=1 Tax=Ancylobacter oerskovii TaxID=459519 RepID=A0ABW4Z4Q6_9HYPH
MDQRAGRTDGPHHKGRNRARAFHYASIDDLRRHGRDWLLACNYAKQLKALRFKTPLEALKLISSEKPKLFVRQPSHDRLGLNT